ncbi:hypothetical protein AB0N07_33585 [Streptomyces sp. NPDC051172]|uniref:hypothetical protein n=1 Tax=Streptomyces sp. NPDC051172 TaxID=3155796 RepID=UPI003414FE5A
MDCQFCTEVTARESTTRIITETAGGRVLLLPTIGALAPGYCLFMPLELLDAAADVAPADLERVAAETEQMRTLIQARYPGCAEGCWASMEPTLGAKSAIQDRPARPASPTGRSSNRASFRSCPASFSNSPCSDRMPSRGYPERSRRCGRRSAAHGVHREAQANHRSRAGTLRHYRRSTCTYRCSARTN